MELLVCRGVIIGAPNGYLCLLSRVVDSAHPAPGRRSEYLVGSGCLRVAPEQARELVMLRLWHRHVAGELGQQVILGRGPRGGPSPGRHLDRRTDGRGQRQRVSDAGRHLPWLGRACGRELDPD
jgi:hypothetical protein